MSPNLQCLGTGHYLCRGGGRGKVKAVLDWLERGSFFHKELIGVTIFLGFARNMKESFDRNLTAYKLNYLFQYVHVLFRSCQGTHMPCT